MDLRILIQTLGESPPPIPPNYLQNLENFLRDFPVQHWTPEYIIFIVQAFQTGIKNYCVEEFLKKIYSNLYTTIVEHISMLMEVYYCMQTIQSHHRNFLWGQFREVYGVTPQTYFVEPFNRFRNHKQNYEAAIQQGFIEFSQTQVDNRNPSSTVRPSSSK